MKSRTRFVPLGIAFTALLVSLWPAVIFADGARGLVKAGYVYTHEEGSLAANQETSNTYEGVAFSLERFSYFWTNGLGLRAQLRRITLNNRDLSASLAKPGLFSLSLYNHQYRRTYGPDGSSFTRRRSTGGRASIRPSKYLKLFGGYSRTGKKGTTLSILDVGPAFSGDADTLATRSDYSQATYNLGAQVFYNRTRFRVEYRRLDLRDDLSSTGDRESDLLKVDASSPVPSYDWVVLSGGYHYRKDQFTFGSIDLSTNLGWAGIKVYLKRDWVIDYRFMYARTDGAGNDLETDNVYNTVSLAKSWQNRYGVRIGYENRIGDDLVDRTESHGLLVNGWARYSDRLTFRGLITVRDRDVVRGATLIGDERAAHHRFSATWVDPKWGNLTLQWKSRMKEHEASLEVRDTLSNLNAGTHFEYNVLSSRLNLRGKGRRGLNLAYAYYLGQYENNSDEESYEFSDHVIRATVHPKAYGNAKFSLGVTYYRSRRDLDLEKFNLTLAGTYTILTDYELGIEYNVFNFDDFRTPDRFYTGNIVEIFAAKDI